MKETMKTALAIILVLLLIMVCLLLSLGLSWVLLNTWNWFSISAGISATVLINWGSIFGLWVFLFMVGIFRFSHSSSRR